MSNSTAVSRGRAGEPGISIREKKICEVVASSPEAEDVLEDLGIDYWFDWKRDLGDAFEAANVNPAQAEQRLVSCRPCAASEPLPADLAKLLDDSDEHWRATLAPAIATALAAAASVHDDRAGRVTQLLKALRAALEKHMMLSRVLLAAAEAIDEKRLCIDRETIRSLRLEHLDAARIAGQLREQQGRFAPGSDAAPLIGALRTVIRETHRHVKIAHNFILPRLVEACREPTAYEPW